jgi:rod shape-determining protein MreD
MWDATRTGVDTPGRVLAASGAVLFFVLIVQVSVVARLGLPGGRPDLVLVLLAAIALAEGPVAGAVLGFGVGLFGDLMSSHVLGQGAVILCLVGYCVGLVEDASERPTRVPLTAVGLACVLGTLGNGAFAAILGESGLGGGQLLVRAATAGVYGLLITPFVVPPVVRGTRLLRGERT